MSMRFGRAAFALFIMPLLVFVVGCPKKPPPDISSTPAPATDSRPAEEVPDTTGFKNASDSSEGSLEDQMTAEIRKLNEQRPLGTVYFDYDKADLRSDALDQLKKNAEWMRAHAQYLVRVEGNADERGTTEYNLALGDQRAAAVKDYLVKAGIAAARLETISYGEEHPVDPGHSEGSWAKNRRADFTITAKTR
ncbi:MAG TPA: peptidoglycan-associated lipoprotein Pal [Candidatus Polarisedimenticolia bacterium]|nr:peptidoglycan-associated lipoprotein Pal [Candidatus Polarisedimenticolia bacterium]